MAASCGSSARGGRRGWAPGPPGTHEWPEHSCSASRDALQLRSESKAIDVRLVHVRAITPLACRLDEHTRGDEEIDRTPGRGLRRLQERHDRGRAQHWMAR